MTKININRSGIQANTEYYKISNILIPDIIKEIEDKVIDAIKKLGHDTSIRENVVSLLKEKGEIKQKDDDTYILFFNKKPIIEWCIPIKFMCVDSEDYRFDIWIKSLM